jgi:hypothetical protein
MNKCAFALAPIVTTAALMLAPGSALASTCQAGNWCGWGSNHTDNLASPSYYVESGPSAGDFSGNGTGNSQYCAAPLASADTSAGEPDQLVGTDNDDNCDGTGAVVSPVVFAGYFTPANLGCNHNPNGSGTCPSAIGGVYLGTADGTVGVGEQG